MQVLMHNKREFMVKLNEPDDTINGQALRQSTFRGKTIATAVTTYVQRFFIRITKCNIQTTYRYKQTAKWKRASAKAPENNFYTKTAMARIDIVRQKQRRYVSKRIAKYHQHE